MSSFGEAHALDGVLDGATVVAVRPRPEPLARQTAGADHLVHRRRHRSDNRVSLRYIADPPTVVEVASPGVPKRTT